MPSVLPEFVGRRQRKIIVDGVKYKAKAQRGCAGCAFSTSKGCITTPVNESDGSLCAATTRDDVTSSIWIKKD